MTDAELVVRAKAGEERAFEELVARHHVACHRLARRLLGNDPDAEDVVQETFVRAYQGMHRYQEQDVFRAWLFRILVNRCRTLQGKNRRRHAWQVSDDAALESAPTRQHADSHEWSDRLQRCLESLDPVSREVVLLKFGEGLEYSEIAAITGGSVPALKMRVLRAREALRPLREHDDD